MEIFFSDKKHCFTRHCTPSMNSSNTAILQAIDKFESLVWLIHRVIHRIYDNSKQSISNIEIKFLIAGKNNTVFT